MSRRCAVKNCRLLTMYCQVPNLRWKGTNLCTYSEDTNMAPSYTVPVLKVIVLSRLCHDLSKSQTANQNHIHFRAMVQSNEPSKEEWGSGKRNRKLVTGICVYSTFIGRNLSRCKQTLGRQADRTYIQPIIYTDMCTLCTGLTVAQSPIFRTLSWPPILLSFSCLRSLLHMLNMYVYVNII